MSADDGVRARVLGPVQLWHGPQRLTLGGRRQRAVLVRLLIEGGALVPVDRLVDDVWNGAAPASARNQVQVRVSELRKLVGPARLAYQEPGYSAEVPTDAGEFETLLQTAREQREHRPADARGTLDRALSLWYADRAYADLADEPWLAPTVARLGELRLVAEELRWSAAIDAGQAHEAVAALVRMVDQHPLREGLWRLLALALYRTDRQVEALETIRAARSRMSGDLGLDAAPALAELEIAILRHDPGLTSVPGRGKSRPATSAAAPSGALHGRQHELQLLGELADRADAGTPQLALVTGQPGIGKTRLAEELCHRLDAAGWATAWGRCQETSGGPPLWPWLQVLSTLPGDWSLDRPGAAYDDRTRFERRQELASRLARLSSATPLVVVIDDLQWADAETVALVDALPELVPAARLLLVATLRADATEELAATTARLVRHGGSVLPLAGLDESAVTDWLAGAGAVLAPDAVTRRTGGNPFLLGETVDWAERHGADAALHEVPTGAAALLRDRVGRLGRQAGWTLAVAAVAGSEVDPDLVAAVLGTDSAEVADRLDLAVDAGVLRAGPAGLRFAHDLVRETVYADVAPLRRRRLHEAVLTELEGRPDPDLAAIAGQALAAGPERRADAVRWSVAAAEQASAALAYDDAVRWWEAALTAQEELGDPSATVELLIRLVGARTHPAAGASDPTRPRSGRGLAPALPRRLRDVTLSPECVRSHHELAAGGRGPD